MISRRRTWISATFVAAVVVSSSLGVAVQPANAIGDLAVSVQPSSVEFQVGGDNREIYATVSNGGPGEVNDVEVTLRIPFGGQLQIIGGTDGCSPSGNRLRCEFDRIDAGASEDVYVLVSPPDSSNLGPNDTRSDSGSVEVSARDDTNGGNNRARFDVVLRGAPQDEGIEISGSVTDYETGDPIVGATVELEDGDGEEHETVTNSNGEYAFIESDDIAPGRVRITVSSDGYRDRSTSLTVADGDTVSDVDFELLPVATTPSSAAPSSAAPSASPSPPAIAATEDERTGSGGNGWFLWLLAILGFLFVVGGIATIVFLFVRRKKDDEDEDGDEGDPLGMDDGPPPIGARGYFRDDQPTAYGASPGAATSMMPRPGMDAPTSVIDRSEFADPDAGFGPGYGQAGHPTTGFGAVSPDRPTSMIDRPQADQPTLYGRPSYGGDSTRMYSGPDLEDGFGAPYSDSRPGGAPSGRHVGPSGGDPTVSSGSYGDHTPRYDQPTGIYQPRRYADSPDTPHGYPTSGGGGYGAGGDYSEPTSLYPRPGGPGTAPQEPGGYGGGDYGYGQGSRRDRYRPDNDEPPRQRGPLDWLED